MVFEYCIGSILLWSIKPPKLHVLFLKSIYEECVLGRAVAVGMLL